MRSRVTPGVSSTMAARRPVSLLKSMDLPTFGRPIDRNQGLGHSASLLSAAERRGFFFLLWHKTLRFARHKQKCPQTKQNLPGYHPGRGAVRQAERKELILSCFPCGNGITSPRRQEEPRGHCRYRSSCKLCAADEPHRTSGKRLRRGWRASSGSCVSYPVLPWKPYT